MAEKEIYKKMKEYVNDRGGRFTRIENAVSAGVPDVNICINGVEVWIECKEALGKKVEIRASQFVWAIEQRAAGGEWYCMIKHGGGYAVGMNNDILKLKKSVDVAEFPNFKSVAEALQFIFMG